MNPASYFYTLLASTIIYTAYATSPSFFAPEAPTENTCYSTNSTSNTTYDFWKPATPRAVDNNSANQTTTLALQSRVEKKAKSQTTK